MRLNLDGASGPIDDLDDRHGLDDTGDVGIHVARSACGIGDLALLVVVMMLLVRIAAFVVMKMRVLVIVVDIAGLSE